MQMELNTNLHKPKLRYLLNITFMVLEQDWFLILKHFDWTLWDQQKKITKPNGDNFTIHEAENDASSTYEVRDQIIF